MDVEILRLVRYGDIEVDGLMEYIHKRFLLSLNAVDVDGCDAVGDVVAVDGKQDVFYKKWFFSLGHGTYFPSRRVFAPQGRTDDTHILQYISPRSQQIFFLCIPSDEHGRRQLLFVEDDNNIVGQASDRIGGRLIGYVEEYQRVAGNIYFKTAIDRRNAPYLEFGYAELDIFHGLPLFIYDSPFHGDTLLRENA